MASKRSRVRAEGRPIVACPLCGAPSPKIVSVGVNIRGIRSSTEYDTCLAHGAFADFGDRVSFADHAADVEYRETGACKREMMFRQQRMK